jgi:hypothetical protein
MLPILVKLPLIVGWLQADPLLLYSGLQQGVQGGFLGGALPTIDPNIGFTSQALGHRAALDVLAGHMPWWNPFEGVGTPLAGEMQSAALFPPSWLLALRNGQVYEHISFQIIAGLSAYALLRRLDLRRLPAFAGAGAFAFNGVFAWLGNAAVNPVALLPVVLLGIESAAASARSGRSGGGLWIIVGLAASLYAGFPEVAYLDGLLAGAWTLTRAGTLPGRARLAFLAKVAFAGVAGILVGAPILVAFLDFLPAAYVGGHAGGDFLHAHLDAANLPLVALPYLRGGIYAQPAQNAFWGGLGGYGGVGGYAGCTLLILAFAGIFGARRQKFRVLLAAWVVVALGLTFGASWLGWLAEFAPGLASIATYRYLPASWILCLCVLAAYAVDDLMAGGRLWHIRFGLSLAAVATIILTPRAMTLPISPSLASVGGVILAAACVASIVVAAFGFRLRLSSNWRAAGIAAALLTEMILLFGFPILFWPRGGTVDLEGIRFLQGHLGLQRFATLGPIAPNYGSYFGIASINYNDLPVPRAWVEFTHDRLDANADAIIFNGSVRAGSAAASAADALLRNRAAYAAVGVRYVVTPPEQKLGDLPDVFRDPVMRIVEMKDAAPYFSATGCRLHAFDRSRVSASCHGPATLQRLELFMPGWRAWVGTIRADVTPAARIFQSVELPAGNSEVLFAFEPPLMGYGYFALAIGIGLLIIDVARSTRRG